MAEYSHAVAFKAKGLGEREMEKVRQHFQRERCSGGGECGPIEKVGENTYRVAFVEKIAQRQVLDRKIHIIHLPWGKLSLSVTLPPIFPDHEVRNLDPYLLLFLKDNPTAVGVLQDQLSSIGCSINILQDKATVSPSGTVAEEWEQQVDQIFSAFSESYSISYELDPGRLQVLLQNPKYETEELRIYKTGDYAVVVGGIKEVEEMMKMVEEMRSIRKECPVLESQYILIEGEFEKEIKAIGPGIKIFRGGLNMIILEGPNKEVQLGASKLTKLTQDIKEKQILFPTAMLYLMKSSGAIARYQTWFQQGVHGLVSLEARLNLVLSSFSSEALEEAAAVVQRDFCVRTLQLEGTSAVYPTLDKLKTALTKAKNQANHNVLRVEVSYHPGPSGVLKTSIQLMGYREDVGRLEEVLLDFKLNYGDTQEQLVLPRPELVDSFDEILHFLGVTMFPAVRLTASHSPSPHVLLFGPRRLVQQAKEILNSALARLIWDELVIDGPGAQLYFQQEGKKSMEGLERSCHVLILKQLGGLGIIKDTSGIWDGDGHSHRNVVPSMPVSNVQLLVTLGHLEEQQVDVLVAPMVDTNASSTSTGSCVMKKAGDQVRTNFELASGGCRCNPGELLQVSGSPSLGSSSILFIECLPWDGAEGPSVTALRTGLRKSLELCAQQGWGSVALPVIGPGSALSFPVREAVEVLTEEIGLFGQTGSTGSVSTIFIVIKPDGPNATQAFQDAYSGLSSGLTNWEGPVSLSSDMNPESLDTPIPWRPVAPPPSAPDMSRPRSTISSSAPSSVFLVLGLLREDVARAAAELPALYESQCCQHSFPEERLAGLRPGEADKLSWMTETLGLCIKQDQVQTMAPGGTATWTVSGLKKQVHEVVQFVRECPQQSPRREMRQKEEDDVYGRVSWCMLGSGGDWFKLPTAASWMLERSEVDRGVVDANGVQWSVDLERMEATAQESRRVTKLKRLQNLPDFSVPLYWDNVAPAEELTMVPLQPSSLEFQTLEKNFRKTVNNTVHSIQRIQSPRLRQAYELQLNYTCHKNGQSRGEAERLLYRGASQEFCESVKQTGFNRSYPGVNGTSYGGGMYFAVAANTSSGYAAKDAEGHRRMFVARVVTGRFTGGHRNMKTPPCCFPRQHHLHYDSAVDDVQNPGLFVVFHDNAAYPDHLITFK